MLLVHISRQEFERKRQIEIERQLARQREIRMQAQEEKKRAEQQRLAAAVEQCVQHGSYIGHSTF